ncbi:MAG: hypothetical protein ACI8UZ_001135, partial [Akkermansiaceae bacterium]
FVVGGGDDHVEDLGKKIDEWLARII